MQHTNTFRHCLVSAQVSADDRTRRQLSIHSIGITQTGNPYKLMEGGVMSDTVLASSTPDDGMTDARVHNCCRLAGCTLHVAHLY